MNFEWNKSNFSRNFKHAKDATTFVEIWREVTEPDDNGFERARKDQELSSDHEDVRESNGFSVTSSLATPPAKKLKVNYEKNSLDTAIKQKKIGEHVLTSNMFLWPSNTIIHTPGLLDSVHNINPFSK